MLSNDILKFAYFHFSNLVYKFHQRNYAEENPHMPSPEYRLQILDQ